MFAYCRNNPVHRIDVSGTNDAVCYNEDGKPLSTEDIENLTGGGGAGVGVQCTVVGGGHGNPVHSGRINATINELYSSGNYTEIYGNRALSTAGLNGSMRPDIIAKKTDGSYEVWEFASPSQALGTSGYLTLEAKIGIMHANNPTVTFHEIVVW